MSINIITTTLSIKETVGSWYNILIYPSNEKGVLQSHFYCRTRFEKSTSTADSVSWVKCMSYNKSDFVERTTKDFSLLQYKITTFTMENISESSKQAAVKHQRTVLKMLILLQQLKSILKYVMNLQ